MESSAVLKSGDICAVKQEKKVPRKRKKRLFQQICKQMEFYFSDANLSKDKFMTELLNQNEEINLDVFLTFNRIKSFTTSTEELAKALLNSTVLQVSEDKQRVKRLTPVKVRENSDECTIYVENIPHFANHDWLSEIFSLYGNILYVSLPRFKQTRAFKGFGFVEFDSEEAVKKTLKAFGAAGCCISPESSPAEMLSIKTFEPETGKKGPQTIPDSTDVLGTRKRHADTDEVLHVDSKKVKFSDELEESVTVNIHQSPDNRSDTESGTKTFQITTDQKEVNSTKERKQKRKWNEAEDEDTKKVKLNDNEIETAAECILDSNDASVSEIRGSGDDAEVLEVVQCEGSAVEGYNFTQEDRDTAPQSSGKKTRRRKKKRNNEKSEFESIGLQIMSKLEWKRLRNQYLTEQWKNMMELKRRIAESRNVPRRRDEEENRAGEPVKGQIITGNYEEKKKEAPKFEPGVIVHIKLVEPPDKKNIKPIKEMIRSLCSVAYIDVGWSSSDIHVRCSSAGDAQTLCKNEHWKEMHILQGEEEGTYWKRILDNWEERHKKNQAKGVEYKRQERGLHRLLKKAEKCVGTHVRFTDEN